MIRRSPHLVHLMIGLSEAQKCMSMVPRIFASYTSARKSFMFAVKQKSVEADRDGQRGR